MSDLADLLAQYKQCDAEVTQMEAQLEALRARRSGIVKTVFDTFGRGPHDVEGKACVAMARGDSYFFRGVAKK